MSSLFTPKMGVSRGIRFVSCSLGLKWEAGVKELNTLSSTKGNALRDLNCRWDFDSMEALLGVHSCSGVGKVCH